MPIPLDIPATIVSRRDTTHDTRVFTVAPGIASYRFRPGQHCLVTVDGSHTRPYSFASSPRQGPAFELAVKRVGVISGQLFALAVGDAVLVSAPINSRFRLDEGDVGPVAMIAGGTGITPFMSILRDAALRGAKNSLTLLFGNKTAADLIYHPELEALAAQMPGFRVIYALSDSWPPDWPGERGFLDAAMIARHVPDVMVPRWMVCGRPLMVVYVKKELLKLGVAPGRIAV